MTIASPETAARKAAALAEALGPAIVAALAEPGVTDVMVNPDGAIWVDRQGGGRRRCEEAMSAADAELVLRLVADHAGEVVSFDNPTVSATLPGGERFQGIYAPVAASSTFAIRKPPTKIFTLDDYIAQGAMTPAQALTLEAAAAARRNILIVGGAGAGKTTLANAILALPAFANDRVLIMEDAAELKCSALDQVPLLTRRADPVVTMADLVRIALRMRPDRIVIGEVRDGSALDMLKAWNTGHPGGLATVHANSATEALSRLEDLIGEVSPVIPYRAIGQAIDLIAFLKRTTPGPMLEALVRVESWDRGTGYRLTSV